MAVEAKISQLNAAGSNIAATSLFESSYDIGGGNFSSVKVTGTQLAAGVATILGLSLGAAFTTTPANAVTLTTTGPTNVTLPTTGTLVNSAVTTLSSLTSVGNITAGTWSSALAANSGSFALTGSSIINVGASAGTSILSLVCSGVNGAALNLNDGTNNKFIRVLANELQVINSDYSAAILSLTDVGGLTASGAYTSGAPVTGTAGAWKMGVLVTDAVVPDTTRYIQLDVGGTLYKLIVST